MLHGFTGGDLRLVCRYVTAYNGIVEDYMSDKVSYVVTSQGWGSQFDQALEDNSSLIFVRPQWIFKCHEKQSLVPYQPFVVAPS
jgi:DNA-repair protein XRCC1